MYQKKTHIRKSRDRARVVLGYEGETEAAFWIFNMCDKG